MSLKVQEIEEGVELSPFDDLWFAREYEKAYIPLDKAVRQKEERRRIEGQKKTERNNHQHRRASVQRQLLPYNSNDGRKF
ncbi:hypothetical protein [Capnocytophaga bilenii]